MTWYPMTCETCKQTVELIENRCPNCLRIAREKEMGVPDKRLAGGPPPGRRSATEVVAATQRDEARAGILIGLRLALAATDRAVDWYTKGGRSGTGDPRVDHERLKGIEAARQCIVTAIHEREP